MRAWPILAALLLASPALAGPQDAWTVDPRASSLTFTASQVGAFVNGRFPSWTGKIVLDPAALAAARIDIRIDMRAGDDQQPRRRFAAARARISSTSQKFPEARFVVDRRSRAKGGDRYEARGKLTIRDVTRDAVLPFTLAIADDPAQPGRLRATARGRLDHEAARLRRRPERMGRRPARSPTRSRSTSPSWRAAAR